ncbi:MAG TPA: hypothetical protein VN285_03090 [Candidatus Deferrimicrobium sp.]|nr:hypothetical protein [Candidatus Deferrimicrobium sp.]
MKDQIFPTDIDVLIIASQLPRWNPTGCRTLRLPIFAVEEIALCCPERDSRYGAGGGATQPSEDSPSGTRWMANCIFGEPLRATGVVRTRG